MLLIGYDPSQPFPGQIGCTADELSRGWLARQRAAKGSPNVLSIAANTLGSWTPRGEDSASLSEG